MTCETARDHLMDVLYGEELAASESYQFFKHLGICRACDGEFRELLETRELMSEWVVDETSAAEAVRPLKRPRRAPWRLMAGGSWQFLQKAAAVFLILVGVASILQSMGLWQVDRVVVSERQLMEMVNDMIVIRQAEERRIIGQALVNFADEMSLQQQSEQQSFNEQLTSLELRYLENLEDTNHYLKVLLTR